MAAYPGCGATAGCVLVLGIAGGTYDDVADGTRGLLDVPFSAGGVAFGTVGGDITDV